MSQPPDVRQHFLGSLSQTERAVLAYEWRFWARPKQLPPDGDWAFWVLKAGRGFGKTRTGAEWVRAQIESGQCKRIALVNDTAADVRDVMITGPAGLVSVCPPWNKPVYVANLRSVTWPNGGIAIAYSAEAPELLRGPEHDGAWADEPSKWKNLKKADTEGGTAWDNLMMGLRIGDPQCVVTMTPRNIAWVRELLLRSGVVVTGGTSYENRDNLSPRWFKNVVSKYENTRLGRQELNAELLEDVEGALWTTHLIEAARVPVFPLDRLRRVVVAIDPAVSKTATSDETGIVVAAVGDDGEAYVLADGSDKYSPDGWARKAIQLYQQWQADRIIAEANNGGDMVSFTVQTVASQMKVHAPVTLVHASRGKQTRAEPIAALYEQGRVHHVGMFVDLEGQMCGWDPRVDTDSPDRMDALVWAMSHLATEMIQEPQDLLFTDTRDPEDAAREARAQAAQAVQDAIEATGIFWPGE